MIIELRYHCCCGTQLQDNTGYGLLVKRLRRRPLTAETGVRFPYGSPMTYRRTKQRFGRNAALFFAFVIRQKHIVIAVKFDYCEGMIRISDMERQIRKNKKTSRVLRRSNSVHIRGIL